MNGSKSTFKRKGYWLTAFAAAVLLAASPGTASAQVEVTGPDDDEVAEGGVATYDVSVKGFIPTGGSAGTLTVTLVVASTNADDGEDGEPGDVSSNLGLVYTVAVPAGQTGANRSRCVQPLRLHPCSDDPRLGRGGRELHGEFHGEPRRH